METHSSIHAKQPRPSEQNLKLAFFSYMLFCSQVSGCHSSESPAWIVGQPAAATSLLGEGSWTAQMFSCQLSCHLQPFPWADGPWLGQGVAAAMTQRHGSCSLWSQPNHFAWIKLFRLNFAEAGEAKMLKSWEWLFVLSLRNLRRAHFEIICDSYGLSHYLWLKD